MARNKIIYDRCCDRCGVSFVGMKAQKFCSAKCRWAKGPVNPVSIACKCCGKEFTGQRNKVYCSKKCKNKVSNAVSNKTEKTKQYKRTWEHKNRPKIYARRRAWLLLNKEKLKASGRDASGHLLENKRETNKRYRKTLAYKQKHAISNAKIIGEIQDCYVANLLEIPVANLPQEVIELKRQQICLLRVLKQKRESGNE
jgi:malate synthase